LDQSIAVPHYGIGEFLRQNCHSPIQLMIKMKQACLSLINFFGGDATLPRFDRLRWDGAALPAQLIDDGARCDMDDTTRWLGK
jgi:hypothetical protein